MWIVCITSVRHVLTVNGYGGRQTKENEKVSVLRVGNFSYIIYVIFYDRLLPSLKDILSLPY